jgi:hypothetical protein
MVARQFIAWDVSKKATRPVGTLRGELPTYFTAQGIRTFYHPIIPCPTGRVLFSHGSQAINCLATFIESLRDNKPPPVCPPANKSFPLLGEIRAERLAKTPPW